MTVEDYLNLVPSANREKPNFIAVITANTSIPARVQELLESMIPIFNIDDAVGDQLDILGKWIGISREVAIPVPGVYFTWDGDYSVGWDYGTWQPASEPTEVTTLPDDVYRTVLKAKIAANRWDGTTDGAYSIWNSLFPNVTILIQDNQNMTYDLAFVGGIIDSLTLALISQGYIALKPEGVRVTAIFTPVDDGPVFAWDLDTDLLKGWDEGSWAIETIPA